MDASIHGRTIGFMLFKEIPSSQETKKRNSIKRPERNRKEKETQAQEITNREREELSRLEVLELMGVNERGLKRHRGAWRKA
jgi:hypothetical protein